MARTTETTYCRICEALCGLEVDVEDGVVREVRPDPAHPVSRGYGCVKGMRFDEVHRDPDRLRYPMERTPLGWKRRSWDDTLSRIGKKLARIREEHGPHAIGLYFGNPTAFSYSHALASQGFVRGLGTRNVFSAGSQDCNDKFVVAEAMFGSSLLQPIPDFAAMRFLLCLGTNPAVSQMSFVHAPRPMEKLREIVDRGGHVVFVDPRRTESARASFATHHFIRPDTDVFLLAAIAKVIASGPDLDRARVGKHTRGFAALARALEQVDIGRAAAITGVDESTIHGLAHSLATTKGAAIHVSTGVNQGTSGALAYFLAQAIHVLTGNLDRRGGVLVGKSLVDIPRMLKLAGLDESKARSRIGDFEPVMGTLPATILPDEILTEGEGRIRALVVTAGNPALSCANSKRMREALSKLDLLVTVDLYRNETSELGHYALPGLDAFQREDTPLPFLTFQPEPYLQWTDAVAKPFGEERSEWSVFADLARSMGVPFFGVPGLSRMLAGARRLGELDPLAPQRAVDMLLRLSGSSIAELRKNPHGVLRAPNEPGSFLGKRVLTSDGLVDLAPPKLVAELGKLDEKAREHAARTRGGRDLLLFSKREKTSHNSWMHNVPDLVQGRRRTNYAYLHPDEARRRGIADGARVRVHNAWGSIELPARLDDDVMVGSIAIPHGWGHRSAGTLRTASSTEGVDVNELMPDGPEHTERVSGMTQLVGVAVTVEPVV